MYNRTIYQLLRLHTTFILLTTDIRMFSVCLCKYMQLSHIAFTQIYGSFSFFFFVYLFLLYISLTTIIAI